MAAKKGLRHKTQRFYIVLAFRTVGNFLVLFSALWLLVVFTPFIATEFHYYYDQATHKTYTLDQTQQGGKTFAALMKEPPPLQITPVNTTSSIVIEKIDANSPVVLNVDAADEPAYLTALKVGVAHTKGTVLPGEVGNSYLFAHSVGSPWDVVRYNAVFYLLRELEPGDRVVIFRDNIRYDFRVYDKKIVDPEDTSWINARYNEPILTLQTCWPPGTVLKRLLVFAKLEASYPLDKNGNPLLSQQVN